MKSIILPLVESPRSAKLAFLVILDFCIFPVLIWLCYAIRQFDLGAEVVPNIPFGTVWVSAIAVLALFLCGVYRFIVRTFNEFFIVKLGLATILSVIGLYLLAYSTHAFIPTPITLVGRTALSVEISTKVSTPFFTAALTLNAVPTALFFRPANGLHSTRGTCL